MKIVVVGGGSAGWITASYIKNNLDCELTVISGDEKPIVGVGESTTPAILKMVTNLPSWKIDSCATLKLGIKFENWYRGDSVWYHLFEDAKKIDGIDSIEYLRNKYPNITSEEFNFFHGNFLFYCKNNVEKPFNNSIPGYGYHVQSDKLGFALKNSISDYKLYTQDVDHVILNEKGIDYLILNNGEKIYADIYFDCSGFKRKLIGEMTTWNSYDDMIANRYIVGKINKNNRPYTVSRALKNGWMWEIDTQNRTNAGFVYCSDIISDEQAMNESGLFYDSKKFDSGKMKDIAIKNCISNGLAQSFIEPLEATSIMITSVTVEKFVETIKRKKKIETLNKVMNRFIEHTKEFVRYHYVLSDRKDSEWWKYWTSLPNNIDEYFNSSMSTKKYCQKNDTLLNHYNIASMMVGFNRFNRIQ